MPKKKTAENISSQRSTVDARGATIHSSGDVYLGPVNTQSAVHDNSVTYTVDKEDNDLIATLSRFLIDRFGEGKIRNGAVVALLIGLVSIVGSLNIPTPTLPRAAISALMYVGLASLILGGLLLAAVQYRYESRCTKCKSFYVMNETSEPAVREVNVKGGVRRTITRTYKCSNCQHEVTKKWNTFIADEDL